MNGFSWSDPLSALLSFSTWPPTYCTLFSPRCLLLSLDVTEVVYRGCRIHSDWCFGPEPWPGRCQRCHLVTLCEIPPPTLSLFLNEFLDAFADEVNHLTDTHEDAETRGDHHEEGEDLLLSGTWYVAVHRVRARRQGALGQAGHVVTIIDVVQDVKEASVEACLEYQTQLWENKWGLNWETHFSGKQMSLHQTISSAALSFIITGRMMHFRSINYCKLITHIASVQSGGMVKSVSDKNGKNEVQKKLSKQFFLWSGENKSFSQMFFPAFCTQPLIHGNYFWHF